MRLLRPALVALVLPAVLLTLPARSGGAPAPGLTGSGPCPGQTGFVCSTLTVPLDHRGRVSGALHLGVAVATNDGAPRGLLLMLTGGPGQPGVSFATRIRERLGPAADAYRLVMLDQRGTGPGALDCPALQQAMGSSDLAPPPAAAVRDCASSLGPRPRLFGSDDVVADLDLLRRALGAQRLTIVGVSYGTYVAERYALAHPGRVARLVLDSVVPHAASAQLETLVLPKVARVLRLVCKTGGCPGDPAADLAAVVAREHDGPRLLDAFVLLSVVDPTFRSAFDVPRLLHDARGGDTTGLDAMLATVRGWERRTPATELSQGLHASALCGDWRFPWGRAGTPVAGRAAALARYAAGLRRSELWPFDRATVVGNGIVQQCLPWPPTAPTPEVRPGARLPDVPTLLVVGDRDLSTPLPWARKEVALAPGGRLVVVKGSGHSVQRRPSGQAVVRAFLLGS